MITVHKKPVMTIMNSDWCCIFMHDDVLAGHVALAPNSQGEYTVWPRSFVSNSSWSFCPYCGEKFEFETCVDENILDK